MRVKINNTTLSLKIGDITEEKVDAIVNAANSSLMGGGGVDGAIHRAGGGEILAECKLIRSKYGRCSTGQAVITTGGNLSAKYVIHTVGPVWRGGSDNEKQLLKNCYINSLKLADKEKIKSLSFPSISTGAYGYPILEASKIALETVAEKIQMFDFNEIRFVLFSENDFEVYKRILRLTIG
ncbi:MAG: O-acetyl-ADP-ribose deacetylase [Candidatus Cloacimonadota bacterium]|nr:O-acetyl-ADP-ribose deacetylase [Candidatus Cloacimonadota bacterium]